MRGADTAPPVMAPLQQRIAAAAVLGVAYLTVRRRYGVEPSRHHLHRCRDGRASRAARGASAALAGPLLAISGRVVGDSTRWQQPPSAAGRLMLAGYLGSGALVEELLWRSPLTVLRGRTSRAIASLLSAAGFLWLHLRRDGAGSAPAHLLTTASWTASTLLALQLRWPVLSHTLYNYAAVSLRPVGAGDCVQRPR